MGDAPRRKLRMQPHRFGLGLAALALFGQLALGALVPRQAQETVASLFPWINSICHADASANPGSGGDRQPHPLPGWIVCPFCLALSVPLAHASAPVQAPHPPVFWVAWRPSPRLARAPPSHEACSAYPRGPPALI